jgi:hypothetical protein
MHERWARLRFSIIGALLAAPPAKGALRAALEELAEREWRHPSTGEPVRFSVSTLERWLYCARNEQHDPVSVLRRKRRAMPVRDIDDPVAAPGWRSMTPTKAGVPAASRNLVALARPAGVAAAVYATVRRSGATA